MPSIYTLVPDIYQLIREKHNGWFTEELARSLSDDLARRLRSQLGEVRGKPRLRLSAMGPRCPRALWCSLHNPELAETLPPWAEVKFSFGHILEALLIVLARAAGHEVTGEQDALELDGIVGHRDCVIDGCTVDIKSSSSISFQKFKTLDYSLVDSFGYLDQLDGYVVASANDPLVSVKDRGYLFAVDKQMGHMHVYEHIARPEHIRERIKYYKAIAGSPNPPACECRTEAIGASGNRKLDFKAGYSPYKWECFPHLRACKYAGGITYFSKVVRWPKGKDGRPLPEINKEGKTIYH